MSTLEEIKAAATALDPEEQVELFRWWTQLDTFRARQLAALKRDLALGIEQLEQGRYRTFDDANLMHLAATSFSTVRLMTRKGQIQRKPLV